MQDICSNKTKINKITDGWIIIAGQQSHNHTLPKKIKSKKSLNEWISPRINYCSIINDNAAVTESYVMYLYKKKKNPLDILNSPCTNRGKNTQFDTTAVRESCVFNGWTKTRCAVITEKSQNSKSKQFAVI